MSVYRFARGRNAGSSTGPNVTGGWSAWQRAHWRGGAGCIASRSTGCCTVVRCQQPLPNGSLTLVYGNPRAQRIGKRGSEYHADLNRCFPRGLLEVPESQIGSSYEHHRAKQLAPLFAASDLLVNLHSTKKPSPPFVRLSGYHKVPSQLLLLSGRLPANILLLDPKHLIGDGSVALTDEFVGVHGGMGVCYESGVASDLSRTKVDSIIRSVLRILEQDMDSIEFVTSDGQIRSSEEANLYGAAVNVSPRDVYEITQLFKLTSEGFRWADGVGDENFQRISAGQPIGFVGSEQFSVNYDSHIVFPKIPALWKVHAPLGWLTRRISA